MIVNYVKRICQIPAQRPTGVFASPQMRRTYYSMSPVMSPVCCLTKAVSKGHEELGLRSLLGSWTEDPNPRLHECLEETAQALDRRHFWLETEIIQ